MIKVQVEEFGGGSLERAEKLLAGITNGVETATKAAMVRTVSHLRTNSTKRIRERYAISAANIRANENIKISYRMGGGIQANVLFSGTKIPLFRYSGASPKSPQFQGERLVHAIVNGQWKTVHPGVPGAGHQLVSTGPTTFQNSFVASFRPGHTGIFERTGGATSTGGAEIKEIMGSSAAQMVGNEEVLENLSEDASNMFETRMDHEIARILAGWGE